MSKRSVYTTITPLPAGITRKAVMEFLLSHVDMIDLNPLVEERHPIKPPPHATPEEFHCVWYSLTDKISYLPGGLYSGNVTYSACFHDLADGIQTHVFAPMGLDIRSKWTINGTMPGEPMQPHELGKGIPMTGLYLREDVDMKCNILMSSFVKKNLRVAHSTLVDRLVVKAQLFDAANTKDSISNSSITIEKNTIGASAGSSPQLSAMSLTQQSSIRSSMKTPSPNPAPQPGPSLAPAPLFQAQQNSYSPGQVDSRLAPPANQQQQSYNSSYDPRIEPQYTMPPQPYGGFSAQQPQYTNQGYQNAYSQSQGKWPQPMELENNNQSNFSTYATVAEMPDTQPDPKKKTSGPPVHPTN